jgi:hypothetical protein
MKRRSLLSVATALRPVMLFLTAAAVVTLTVAPHGARALVAGAVSSGRAASAGQARSGSSAANPASEQAVTGGNAGIPWAPQWSSEQPGTPTGDGDTWYNTWADDGNIYATSDDSLGFNTACNSNIVVNELTGNDPSELASPFSNCMTAYGSEGAKQNYHDGRTWKTSGIISVDRTLYVVVSRQQDAEGGYPNGFQPSADASIIKSADHGRTWSNSFGATDDPNGAAPPPDPNGRGAEAMFPGSSFATPEFINYGQDDDPASTADGGDQYVYAISNDGFAYDGSYMILGRVPRGKIGDLNAADWQFYTGPPGGSGSNPGNWSSNVRAATHIISAPHQLSQSGVQHISALHEYIMTDFYYPFNAQWPKQGITAHTTWSFYQAPHPWGPWTKFYSQPTVQCYMSCDPASASPIGLYFPALVSKFTDMDGLSDVIFSPGDWNDRHRPEQNWYKLHAFPFTLTTTTSRVIDDTMMPGTYTGNWESDYRLGGYYDNSVHYAAQSGATASYTFYGDSIAWVGGKGANYGYARVPVDGGTPVLVDTYAPQQEKQQVLFEKDGLSNGKHTLTITVTGQKDSASSGIQVDIDAFIVGHQ